MGFVLFSQAAQAASSCTASVLPSTVPAKAVAVPFNFSITNTGSAAITYIKVVVPSGDFLLTTYPVSGWKIYTSSTLAELVDGSLAPSSTLSFTFHVTTGKTEAPPANWEISTSAGVGEVSCTGSLGTAISGFADYVPPEILRVWVTGITDSTSTINWTTDEPASSIIEYGPTENLGFTKINSELVKSHAIFLTGLTANTTYYFSALSTDASGNTGVIYDNSFSTAISVKPRIITTPPPPSPQPKTIIKRTTDTTAPKVSIATNLTKTFTNPPVISGRATDVYGIAAVEYSTDGGLNWLPVDKLSSPGGKDTSFSFTPVLFDDGNYKIAARATDGSGNRKTSKSYTLVIDRLPPIVGPALVSVGPLILTPSQDGNLITVPGVPHKITLSSAGGAVTVDLLIEGSTHSLAHSPETGLWNGAFFIDKPGTYELIARAKDGGENTTERTLINVTVLEPGMVTGPTGGTITAYYQEPTSKAWGIWDGRSFSQNNPQNFKDNNYSLFLPSGTYYLKIESPGYKTITSNIFRVETPTPITTSFTLNKPGPLNFLNISFDSAEVVPQRPQPSLEENPLLGRQAPIFFLPAIEGTFDSAALRGRISVLSFINTWSAPSVEQVLILNDFPHPDRLGTVVVQENQSRTKIFAQRGRYGINLATDEDGQLVDDFNIFTTPTHVFMDRRGVIRKIVPGVLSIEEIKGILLEIL